jgi:hypothetical protein
MPQLSPTPLVVKSIVENTLRFNALPMYLTFSEMAAKDFQLQMISRKIYTAFEKHVEVKFDDTIDSLYKKILAR